MHTPARHHLRHHAHAQNIYGYSQSLYLVYTLVLPTQATFSTSSMISAEETGHVYYSCSCGVPQTQIISLLKCESSELIFQYLKN